MASSSTQTQGKKCNECNLKAVSACTGCDKLFCNQHKKIHRDQLDEGIGDILTKFNQMISRLNPQTNKHDRQKLNKEIDDWEKTSIAKIQDHAKTLKNILSQSFDIRKNNELSNEVQTHTEELMKIRDEKNFFESDLEEWNKKLDTIETDFSAPVKVHLIRRKGV
jgi:predicted nuclease with TOPRIM domain